MSNHHEEMEAHAAEMQRRDDLAFVNNVEIGLWAIAGLRLDDLPKTGGKLARMRLEYAICCAKDTLQRLGLTRVGPRVAGEHQAVALEMRRDGNKLPTDWQQERVTRARDTDRIERLYRHWPANYDETFAAIGKAVTVHPGGSIGISVRAFYRALSYPDAIADRLEQTT